MALEHARAYVHALRLKQMRRLCPGSNVTPPGSVVTLVLGDLITAAAARQESNVIKSVSDGFVEQLAPMQADSHHSLFGRPVETQSRVREGFHGRASRPSRAHARASHKRDSLSAVLQSTWNHFQARPTRTA